jgi:hypothetical protein
MRMFVIAAALGLIGTASALADSASPYAGFESRQIKALSPQQIDDLRAGRGMGLALPAELNGYPGPLHVLELADKLELSASQREHIEALIAQMKADAIPLGERLIAQEAELDRLFAGRTATPASLETSTAAISATRAALRNAHLKYHLATLDVMTQAQIADYQRLRGYAASHGHGHRKH